MIIGDIADIKRNYRICRDSCPRNGQNHTAAYSTRESGYNLLIRRF